eukprot:1951008-Amphidinium_carterae.1
MAYAQETAATTAASEHTTQTLPSAVPIHRTPAMPSVEFNDLDNESTLTIMNLGASPRKQANFFKSDSKWQYYQYYHAQWCGFVQSYREFHEMSEIIDPPGGEVFLWVHMSIELRKQAMRDNDLCDRYCFGSRFQALVHRATSVQSQWTTQPLQSASR